MINTIIEIKYEHYSENVIVTSENLSEVLELSKKYPWQYIVKGEIKVPNFYKLMEVKYSRDVNKQCSWETIITGYKQCTVYLNTFGVSKWVELPKRETGITNLAIRELTWGYEKR